MPSLKRRVPFGWIAFGLYTISLGLPAIVAIHKPILWGAPHDELMFGVQCLLIGWVTIPWYANLALWIAGLALAFRQPTVAAGCSIIAIGLALSLGIYMGEYVRAPHVGYVAWLASMILTLVAALAAPRAADRLEHVVE